MVSRFHPGDAGKTPEVGAEVEFRKTRSQKAASGGIFLRDLFQIGAIYD